MTIINSVGLTPLPWTTSPWSIALIHAMSLHGTLVLTFLEDSNKLSQSNDVIWVGQTLEHNKGILNISRYSVQEWQLPDFPFSRLSHALSSKQISTTTEDVSILFQSRCHMNDVTIITIINLAITTCNSQSRQPTQEVCMWMLHQHSHSPATRVTLQWKPHNVSFETEDWQLKIQWKSSCAPCGNIGLTAIGSVWSVRRFVTS